MKLYWHETWILLALTPLAAGLAESQAAGYNGYWSWGWFLGLTIIFALFIALIQGTLWALDQAGMEAA